MDFWLPYLAGFGIWLVIFQSSLIPHFVGLCVKAPWMTSRQLGDWLLAKRHDWLFFLWNCGMCQAMWTANLILLVRWSQEFPHYDRWLEEGLLWFASVAGYRLFQLPFENPAPAPAVPAPEVPALVAKKVMRLTPEERHVMKFFGSEPCYFEGCEEMRKAFRAEDSAAEEANCPPCERGEIVRRFRDEVRQKLGYTKEQVPDLLPGRNTDSARNLAPTEDNGHRTPHQGP